MTVCPSVIRAENTAYVPPARLIPLLTARYRSEKHLLFVHSSRSGTMGGSSSKPEKTADKVASKAEKVLNSVNGDIKSAASDVKKGVDKAVTKTNKEVAKTGKEVGKAIDTLLGETKKEKSHTTEVAVGVPLVALIIAGGYFLWKKKPWKKSGKAASA